MSDIFKFFVMICQAVVVWSLYEILIIIELVFELRGADRLGLIRVIDSMYVIVSFSSILMMYGISYSVWNARIAENKISKQSLTDSAID